MPIATMALRRRSGRNWDMLAPIITPSKLVRIKALTEPKNTALGELEEPLRAIAASWLLSPISAKKTVKKVNPKSCQFIKSILYYIRE
jgi:hypothetical protein